MVDVVVACTDVTIPSLSMRKEQLVAVPLITLIWLDLLAMLCFWTASQNERGRSACIHNNVFSIQMESMLLYIMRGVHASQ